MDFDRHHAVAGWGAMGIGLIIWVVIIGLIVWLVVRALSQRSSHSESAEELLRRRFAAGEIDEEEFAKRSEVLRRK
jgi:putative membrane protein